jgi:carboxyl-terminal processing protease
MPAKQHRMRVVPSAALIISSLLAGGWLVQRAVNGRDDRAREGALLLEQVMARVQQNYVEAVPEEDLWELATRGMLDEIGDPNSAYLTPERLERLNRVAANSYRGVGVTVDVRDGWVTVTQPRAGSPAERAGIQVGDRLVEVDGKPMQGWTVGEARDALQGPLGTSVALVVERQGTRLRVTLERADIRRSSVARATLLDGGVAYLSVTTFSDSTESEVVATVDSLRRLGATSLVLDLRGNPGGLLSQGVSVADLFLSPGQRIVTTRGRVQQANAVHVDETPERWPQLPVAVLVNGGTASAAEIVAGALQDHDRALVIGRVTYGKGSAQAVYPLDNGAALQLTNARWFTPLGRSIEVAAEGEERLADADTARPVFRTAMGRSVLGGGGIVPDLVAGDSVPDRAERRLFAELGADVPKWRNLVGTQVAALLRSGAVRDSMFTVIPAWRARLRAAVQREGLRLSESTFDEARAVIDRELGREIARQAFGVPYQQRRSVRADVVVQRAADVLRRAKEPRQVFAE